MFTDVKQDAWYAALVNTAATLGLMQGDPDGTFRPDDPPTRAELAAVSVRQAMNGLAILRWQGEQLRAQVAPAVIYIQAGNAIGAGVVVHPSGYVITCNHVIAGLQQQDPFWCTWPDGGDDLQHAQPSLQIVATAPAVDLALLQIAWQRDGGFPSVRLAVTPAEPAEPVVMLGSPAGIPGWESHGLVARTDISLGGQLPPDLMCISGAVNPGNSGGALIRAADGTLLGIVDAKLVDVAIEAMGFAVPVSAVADLMAKAGVIQP